MQNVEGITWEEFERLFKAHYANVEQQADVVSRFERLTQGNRTVNQYVMEFTELSSLALSPAVSDTYRIAKFKNGLNRNIYNRIAIHSFTTLSEVVLAAQRAEAIENDHGARKNRGNDRKMNKKNQGQ